VSEHQPPDEEPQVEESYVDTSPEAQEASRQAYLAEHGHLPGEAATPGEPGKPGRHGESGGGSGGGAGGAGGEGGEGDPRGGGGKGGEGGIGGAGTPGVNFFTRRPENVLEWAVIWLIIGGCVSSIANLLVDVF
jgi:hypothetical protein